MSRHSKVKKKETENVLPAFSTNPPHVIEHIIKTVFRSDLNKKLKHKDFFLVQTAAGRPLFQVAANVLLELVHIGMLHGAKLALERCPFRQSVVVGVG